MYFLSWEGSLYFPRQRSESIEGGRWGISLFRVQTFAEENVLNPSHPFPVVRGVEHQNQLLLPTFIQLSLGRSVTIWADTPVYTGCLKTRGRLRLGQSVYIVVVDQRNGSGGKVVLERLS